MGIKGAELKGNYPYYCKYNMYIEYLKRKNVNI